MALSTGRLQTARGQSRSVSESEQRAIPVTSVARTCAPSECDSGHKVRLGAEELGNIKQAVAQQYFSRELWVFSSDTTVVSDGAAHAKSRHMATVARNRSPGSAVPSDLR